MPPESPQFDVAAMWTDAMDMMRELSLDLPPYQAEGLIFLLNAKGETTEKIPFSTVWDVTLFDRVRHLLPRAKEVR
jgi:hypothetical protein